jgi:hypothetical protein
MMNRIAAVFMILSVIISPAFCAFSENDAGTSAAQFLKLEPGARAAAMGSAFAAISDDSTAVYWNPAGLNQVRGGSVALMHAAWFEEINYDWFSYAQPIAHAGVIGIGVQYLSYGSMSELDDTGLETGSFSPADTAMTVSYGNSLFGIPVGASIKYISSKIKNTATAYAADVGMLYGFPGDKLMVGAAVQNVGTNMKYIAEASPLPMNVRAGMAYHIGKNWCAALDLNAPIDNAPSFGAGTEYVFRLNPALSVAGRAGYNTRNIETGGLNGVTAGLGFTYERYTIDYAYVPYGNLGDTNRISINIKF